MRRRLFLLVSFAVLLGLLPLHSAFAQSGDTVRLSLDQVLETALENNLDLVSARVDPQIAEQEIAQFEAPFDATFSTGATFTDLDSDSTITDNTNPAAAASLGERKTETLSADVRLDHTLQFGADYSVSYSYSDFDRFNRSIEQTFGFLSEDTVASTSDTLSFTFNLPLLGGLGKEVNTVNILLARSGLDISREDLRLQAITTLQIAEDAYWDVLAEKEALRISRLALNRAEDLLELNRKKVEVGTLAPIEITEAEAGVASQVEAVIVAETNLENAEDALLQILAVPEDDPMWDRSLEIVDVPSFQPIDIDLDQAIETALAQRPEMINTRKRLRESELSERVAKRDVRHRLDLSATVNPLVNGDTDVFAQQLLPPGPPSDTNTDSEQTDWSLGLRYTLPLRNRSAKAGYRIATLNREKSGLAVQSQEQAIRVDVRRSVRNVESGVQRVEAARKNVELQEKKLEAEQKKFDNGMSTSFEVLTFQNDLADAELGEIRARLDYLKFLTALETAKGTLLEARGMKLGD